MKPQEDVDEDTLSEGTIFLSFLKDVAVNILGLGVFDSGRIPNLTNTRAFPAL